MTEELCKHYNKDFGIECRIGRFHNIYGPFGTWKGQPPVVSSVMTLYTLAAHVYLCILAYSLLHIVCDLFCRW